MVDCVVCRHSDPLQPRKKRITNLSLGDSTELELAKSRSKITELPGEILSCVLEEVIDADWTDVYRLSRVCRVFHYHSQRFIFKSISFRVKEKLYGQSHSLIPPCRKILDLYDLIIADPDLGGCCKNLAITLPEKWKAGDLAFSDYQLAVILSELLPNVKKLEVFGDFIPQFTVPFLSQTFQKMRFLDHVQFGCLDGSEAMYEWEYGQRHMADIWELIRDLKLVHLGVRDLRPNEDGSSWRLPEAYVNTSTIRELKLEDYGETPESLESLLKLPEALWRFDFSIYGTNKACIWSLQKLQTLLWQSRRSLTISPMFPICLDRQIPEGLQFPSFRDFEKLEILSLSNCDLQYLIVTAEEACNAILAPQLREFVWDFSDQNQEWGVFGMEQRDWLLQFAQLAIARGSKLKKIQIVWDPDIENDEEEVFSASMLVEHFWPWDLIDDVAATVSANIQIIYSDHITRDEFDVMVDGYVQEEYDSTPSFESEFDTEDDSEDKWSD